MTFYFGSASSHRLDTCHKDIQAIMNLALSMSDTDMTIVCGERGKEAQEKALREKKSKAKWGQSPHNFKVKDAGGCPAVDVVPYKDGEIQWNSKALFHRIADFIMAANTQLLEQGKVSHVLRWGNDWDQDGIFVEDDLDEEFIDMPHWEIENWRDIVEKL